MLPGVPAPGRVNGGFSKDVVLTLGQHTVGDGDQTCRHGEFKTIGGFIPGVIVDWILGGIVPIGLAAGAVIGGDSISPAVKGGLLYTALGLYGASRIGLYIFINDHISVYNGYMRELLFNEKATGKGMHGSLLGIKIEVKI